jgi:predicted SnoaL-like aldol condensation-catalyzing enzyme
MNNITYHFPDGFYQLAALCEGVQQDGSASSSATSSSSQQPVQQQGGQSLQLNAVNVKPVPQPQPNKHARTHAEQLMNGYRPGGTAIDNRNKQPAPNPPVKQNSIIAFFMAFLKKANEFQIRLLKAVIENPIVEVIDALLSIPFIPQMIKEAKEKERERWANTSDRDFCYEFTKNQQQFIDCLRDLHNAEMNKINKETP